MIKAIIIDDEVHCIETLSFCWKIIAREVQVIEQCMSAKKGLEAIERFKPELVFLDIEMPVMNGFELLEQLSNYFLCRHIHYQLRSICHKSHSLQCFGLFIKTN